MSFLRPLTNPEGLLVYHHVDGYVEFSWVDTKGNVQVARCMPASLNRLCLNSLKTWNWENRKCKELTVRETCVNRSTGKEQKKLGDKLGIEDLIVRDHKVALTIRPNRYFKKTVTLYLWTTTWVYLMRNVAERR